MLSTVHNKLGGIIPLLLLCLMVVRPSAVAGGRLLENIAQHNKAAPSGQSYGSHSSEDNFNLASVSPLAEDIANSQPNLDGNSLNFKRKILTGKGTASSRPNLGRGTRMLLAVLPAGPSPGDGHKYTNGRRVTEKKELESVPKVPSTNTEYTPATGVHGFRKEATVEFQALPQGSSPGVGHK